MAVIESTSCAARGSYTLCRDGYIFSTGPLSTNEWTTTPARIPRAKSDSVTAARASFTAHHLAAEHRQRQRGELVDALGVAIVDGIDVHLVAARARPAHVRERQRLNRRGGPADVRALEVGGALRDGLVRADGHDRVRVELEETDHVAAGYRRFAA